MLPETSRIKLILSQSPLVVFTRCLDPGAETSVCANAAARRCQNNRRRPGCVNQSVLKHGCVQRGSGPESAGCADTAAPAKRSVCRGSLHLAAQPDRGCLFALHLTQERSAGPVLFGARRCWTLRVLKRAPPL